MNQKKQVQKISILLVDLDRSTNQILQAIDKNKKLQMEVEKELERLETMLIQPLSADIRKNKN